VKDLRRESHDLITSLAFVVIKAANEFKDKTMIKRKGLHKQDMAV